MQFVVNDDVSGMVDNNKNSDFELPLLKPPTEDEVTESRAERIKSWERRIRQVTCFSTKPFPVLLMLQVLYCDSATP